jgi:hypothetical protein
LKKLEMKKLEMKQRHHAKNYEMLPVLPTIPALPPPQFLEDEASHLWVMIQ